MGDDAAARDLEGLDRRSVLSVCMKIAVLSQAHPREDGSAEFPRFPLAKRSDTLFLRAEIRRAMQGRPDVAASVLNEARLRRLAGGR